MQLDSNLFRKALLGYINLYWVLVEQAQTSLTKVNNGSE